MSLSLARTSPRFLTTLQLESVVIISHARRSFISSFFPPFHEEICTKIHVLLLISELHVSTACSISGFARPTLPAFIIGFLAGASYQSPQYPCNAAILASNPESRTWRKDVYCVVTCILCAISSANLRADSFFFSSSRLQNCAPGTGCHLCRKRTIADSLLSYAESSLSLGACDPCQNCVTKYPWPPIESQWDEILSQAMTRTTGEIGQGRWRSGGRTTEGAEEGRLTAAEEELA